MSKRFDRFGIDIVSYHIVCTHVGTHHLHRIPNFALQIRRSQEAFVVYDAYGVPKYSPATAAKPTWVSSMLIYEFLFYANLIFWFAVLYFARDLETTHQALLSVCKPETLPR
jgi:hypothetical protein